MRWLLVSSLVTLPLLVCPNVQQEASGVDSYTGENGSHSEDDSSTEEEEEEQQQQGEEVEEVEEEEDNAACYPTNSPPPMFKLDKNSKEAIEELKHVLRKLGADPAKLERIYSMQRAKGKHCKYKEDMRWYRAKYKYNGQKCKYKWTRCPKCKIILKSRKGPKCSSH